MGETGPTTPPDPGAGHTYAGHTYQETPSYPPPQYPPSPHRPRQDTPGWAWALITLLTVAVVVMGAVTITDQQRSEERRVGKEWREGGGRGAGNGESGRGEVWTRKEGTENA